MLVQLGDRVFKLSPRAWLVLEGMSQNIDAEGIAMRLNASAALSGRVTGEDARRMADRVREQVFGSSAFRALPSNLWARVTLFSGPQLRRPLTQIAGAYASPALFYVAFLVAAIGNLLWMIAGPSPTLTHHDLVRTPIVLLGMLAISFLHEIAHAAAAHRYHAAPSAIGAGLYMGVPVLYADVTSIWCLRPRERIVVNLAGVQAQLVLNLLLIVLTACIANPSAHWILLTLCWANAAAAFVNLIPFSKLDGYWVIADALGSPHLERETNRAIADGVRRLLGRSPIAPRASLPLTVYALGQLAMYALFAQWLLMAVMHVVATFLHAATFVAGVRALFAGSVWQIALLAFLILRLSVRMISGGKNQP